VPEKFADELPKVNDGVPPPPWGGRTLTRIYRPSGTLRIRIPNSKRLSSRPSLRPTKNSSNLFLNSGTGASRSHTTGLPRTTAHNLEPTTSRERRWLSRTSS
jgi:hypothetical protein